MGLDYYLGSDGRPNFFVEKNSWEDASREHLQILHQKQESLIPDKLIFKNIDYFYDDFGHLLHPRLKDPKTKRPLTIPKLATYQRDWWQYQDDLATPKSNKIGLTTTSGLELFWSRLKPEEAGYDALWVAQTQRMINVHMLKLKNHIRQSKKYSKYMITRPDLTMFREEKSKASVIYIVNPYDEQNFSRIIGIGASESLAYSWPNVNRVHGSDISLIKHKDQKEFFAGLYSRVANTEGIIKFESIPNGQQGEFWNIINRSRYKKNIDVDDIDDNVDEKAGEFKVYDIDYRQAVAAEVITDRFIQKQRSRLGELLFSQLFECNFLPPGNQWYKAEWIKAGGYTVGW